MIAFVASLFVATAGPASAGDVTYCNNDRTPPPKGENYKFVTLANAGYVVLMINLCAARIETPSQRAAYGDVSWTGDYSLDNPFNSFKLTIRLEKSEQVRETHTCDLTAGINRYSSTPNPGSALRCKTSWWRNAAKNHWTSDGVVQYDLRNDGVGTYTWNLRGSPEIY